jgi:hypothetical protein
MKPTPANMKLPTTATTPPRMSWFEHVVQQTHEAPPKAFLAGGLLDYSKEFRRASRVKKGKLVTSIGFNRAKQQSQRQPRSCSVSRVSVTTSLKSSRAFRSLPLPRHRIAFLAARQRLIQGLCSSG